MSTPPSVSASMPDIGIRALYMVLFALVFWILFWALAITAAIQLILRLANGQPNPELVRLGGGLAAYSRQIIEFLTFASDTVPYPFSSWPTVS